MPDENALTRREKNENFGHTSPPLEIPEAATYVWNWYQELSQRSLRVQNGICIPISWAEIHYWKQLKEILITAREIEMIEAMDNAFCEETNKELKAYSEREKDKAEQARNK